MDLKNMNMSDLKGKLGAIDKKTLIKFGIGFGAIILFLIIYYVILNPMVTEKKAKYADKLLKENEITQFSNDIIIYKNKLKKLKPEFEKTSTLFHSKAEVEDLYQSLSRYATVNGLVISKIEKKKPEAVLKPDIASQAQRYPKLPQPEVQNLTWHGRGTSLCRLNTDHVQNQRSPEIEIHHDVRRRVELQGSSSQPF